MAQTPDRFLLDLTHALAREVGPSGVRVNCVAPGVIDTDMNGRLTYEEMLALTDEIPLMRLGTAEEAAKAILQHTPDGEKIRYTVASPDLWNRRQDSGKSGFEIMTDAGLRGLKKADNTRIAGWRTVREYLNAASGQPRLYITEDCTELIRCLPALRFDERVCEDAAGTPRWVHIGYRSGDGRQRRQMLSLRDGRYRPLGE